MTLRLVRAATCSDKDVFPAVGVGQGDAALVVEATEPFDEFDLGRLGVVEAERADQGNPAFKALGRVRTQRAKHLRPESTRGPASARAQVAASSSS